MLAQLREAARALRADSEERAHRFYGHRFGRGARNNACAASCQLASSNTLGSKAPRLQLLVGAERLANVHGSSLVLHSFAHRKPWAKAASPQSTASLQRLRAPRSLPARARARGAVAGAELPKATPTRNT